MSPFIINNIYFSKFQLLLQFGILFFFGGGGEKKKDSNKKKFRTQKRVIISIAGVNTRTSCKQLFKEVKILTLLPPPLSLSLSLHMHTHIGSNMFY
jgi:hypothetical protein